LCQMRIRVDAWVYLSQSACIAAVALQRPPVPLR
jgi:hypothetical protein